MGFNKAFEDKKFMIFYVRKLSYILIILFLIIPSIILFFSNINDSKEAAIFLFIGGLVVSFLNYKKDKDERVIRFLNKWL